MRAGITILPEHRRPELERRWRAAETYGFHHAWTFDHLGWRTLVDGPWFGSVPTLTAAAMVTSHIEIGMLVASPNFRLPAPFARDLIALDDLSQGRFTLGVGAGQPGRLRLPRHGLETGQPARPLRRVRRGARPAAAGEPGVVVGRLLRGGRGAQHARCVQQPRLPFLVAANGPKAMALAARFGEGWVTTGMRGAETMGEWWDAVAEAHRRFDDALDRSGPLTRPRAQISADRFGTCLFAVQCRVLSRFCRKVCRTRLHRHGGALAARDWHLCRGRIGPRRGGGGRAAGTQRGAMTELFGNLTPAEQIDLRARGRQRLWGRGRHRLHRGRLVDVGAPGPVGTGEDLGLDRVGHRRRAGRTRPRRRRRGDGLHRRPAPVGDRDRGRAGRGPGHPRLRRVPAGQRAGRGAAHARPSPSACATPTASASNTAGSTPPSGSPTGSWSWPTATARRCRAGSAWSCRSPRTSWRAGSAPPGRR